MGFDVTGAHPKSKEGEYFHANCANWDLLWEWITEHCFDILTLNQVIGGTYNDGTGIEEEKAEIIAQRLQNLLDSDEYPKYVENEDGLPFGNQVVYPCKGLVQTFLIFARSSGGFYIS